MKKTMECLILLFVFLLAGCQQTPPQSGDAVVPEPPQVELLEYSVVERKDMTYPGFSRMTYRVVFNVKEAPDEDRVRLTSKVIWGDGNKQWGKFTVFGYLLDMDTNSIAYSVAEFTNVGLQKFRIEPAAVEFRDLIETQNEQ